MNAREKENQMLFRRQAALCDIKDAVEALGHDWTETQKEKHLSPIHRVDGIYIDLDIKPQRTGASNLSLGRITGKLRVTYGGYGNRRTHPEGKNGLNIDKIAKGIDRYIEGRKREIIQKEKHEVSVRCSKTLANELNETYGVKYSSCIYADACGMSDKVVLAGKMSCTPAEAREILTAVRKVLDARKAA